jgi:hypothetical protein
MNVLQSDFCDAENFQIVILVQKIFDNRNYLQTMKPYFHSTLNNNCYVTSVQTFIITA